MKLAITLAFALVGCVGYETSQVNLRTAVDAQQEGLDRCYEVALAQDGQVEGTMTVVLRVPTRGNGQIDLVHPTNKSQLVNPRLHRCVQKLLVGVPIGVRPVQDDLYVEYTFQFQNAAPES